MRRFLSPIQKLFLQKFNSLANILKNKKIV